MMAFNILGNNGPKATIAQAVTHSGGILRDCPEINSIRRGGIASSPFLFDGRWDGLNSVIRLPAGTRCVKIVEGDMEQCSVWEVTLPGGVSKDDLLVAPRHTGDGSISAWRRAGYVFS